MKIAKTSFRRGILILLFLRKVEKMNVIQLLDENSSPRAPNGNGLYVLYGNKVLPGGPYKTPHDAQLDYPSAVPRSSARQPVTLPDRVFGAVFPGMDPFNR
nr:hypothetical protein [Komagataeibacter europaeus]